MRLIEELIEQIKAEIREEMRENADRKAPLAKEDLVSAFREFAQTVMPQMVEEARQIRAATITLDDAAVYMGVHKDTLRKMVREKEIPHVRVAGRILFRAQTLDDYMAEQERKSVIKVSG